jgi:hypothetical protein
MRKCGYCCGKFFCVRCNVRRSIFRFVPLRLCCNPDRLICKLQMTKNLSGGGILCLSKFSRVLLVRNAIFRFVCLNSLVIYSVYLPTYVKVTHLYLEVCVALLECCFCGVMGNELLCRMFWMILSSFWYSSLCSNNTTGMSFLKVHLDIIAQEEPRGCTILLSVYFDN